MNTHEFHKGMRDHFGIVDAGRFMDPVMLRMGKISINITSFDLWLKEQIGYDYEISDGASMKDAIIKHFSEEAGEFIRRSI